MRQASAKFQWVVLAASVAGWGWCAACSREPNPAARRGAAPRPERPTDSAPQASAEPSSGGQRPEAADPYAARREAMVRRQIEARGVRDARVLAAMRRVPRHVFVPAELRDAAYADHPLPIGHGQTISQPYIVALMTELARPRPDSKALDIGTGSGYQAAVLAELCREVYSIEIIPELAEEAAKRLKRLGYGNVRVRCGDGYRGWPEQAPFDVIIVAAAPDHVPEPLVEQLAPGGRLVIPVGRFSQELVVVERRPDGSLRRWTAERVVFVPMTGEAERRD